MPIVEYFDADDNGTDSFQSLVDEKKIRHNVIHSFEEYDKNAIRLLTDAVPIAAKAHAALRDAKDPEIIAGLTHATKFPLFNHLVIIDTITSLMMTAITDAKLGNDPMKSLWDPAVRNKYFNDPQYLTVYNFGTQGVMRRIKNLRSRGARVIVVAHEDEQIDLSTQLKKRAPQANKALYEALMGASSDVFRLRKASEDLSNNEGVVMLKAGTRLLHLQETSEMVAKFHVDRQYSDNIPSLVLNPTMHKLFDALHKKPSFLVLYGPPGCLAADTFIQYRVHSDGAPCNTKGGTIERLYERFNGVLLGDGRGKNRNTQVKDATYTAPSMTEEGTIAHGRIIGVVKSGAKPCFLLTTASGSIEATEDHRFATEAGYKKLSDLAVGDLVSMHVGYIDKPNKGVRRLKIHNRPHVFVKSHPVAGVKMVDKYRYHRLAKHRAVVEADMNNLPYQEYIDRLNEGDLEGLVFLSREQNVHHLDENPLNNSLENLEIISNVEHSRHHALEGGADRVLYHTVLEAITSIEHVGNRETYDVMMEGPDHNFVANKFVVHNSGKTTLALSELVDTPAAPAKVQLAPPSTTVEQTNDRTIEQPAAITKAN